jgi:hypothetical protein
VWGVLALTRVGSRPFHGGSKHKSRHLLLTSLGTTSEPADTGPAMGPEMGLEVGRRPSGCPVTHLRHARSTDWSQPAQIRSDFILAGTSRLTSLSTPWAERERARESERERERERERDAFLPLCLSVSVCPRLYACGPAGASALTAPPPAISDRMVL